MSTCLAGARCDWLFSLARKLWLYMLVSVICEGEEDLGIILGKADPPNIAERFW